MPSPTGEKTVSRFRLGPGGLIYLLSTALILGAAIYTQANLLFWSFGLMAGALAASLVLGWLSFRAIQVERLASGHAVAGERLVLRYHLTNRSWLPLFSLIIRENWGRGERGWKKSGPLATRPQKLRGRPHGWMLHLGPHQTLQAEALCFPMRRGLLNLERIAMESSFPFGILRRVVEFHQPEQILIYPTLYRMNRRLLYSLANLDASGRKQLEKPGGNEEFFGIRPYRPGDSLKLIEWRRTARTGQLVAREMTRPSPPRVMVLLDLTFDRARPRDQTGQPAPATDQPEGRDEHPNPQPNLPIQEKAINLTASLICDAHFHGYQVGLAVTGVACPAFQVHHSSPHRTRMLEALAGLDLSRRTKEAAHLPARPSVIVRPDAGDASDATPVSRDQPALFHADDLHPYVHRESTSQPDSM